MKTINVTRIFVLALLIGFISTVAAYAASPAAVTAKNIRQKFIQAVQNPEDLTTIPTDGQAEVLFTVDDKGSVDIKKLEASNDEVANYIRTRLSNVPCQDALYPYNQYYKVKFTFRQE